VRAGGGDGAGEPGEAMFETSPGFRVSLRSEVVLGSDDGLSTTVLGFCAVSDVDVGLVGVAATGHRDRTPRRVAPPPMTAWAVSAVTP